MERLVSDESDVCASEVEVVLETIRLGCIENKSGVALFAFSVSVVLVNFTLRNVSLETFIVFQVESIVALLTFSLRLGCGQEVGLAIVYWSNCDASLFIVGSLQINVLIVIALSACILILCLFAESQRGGLDAFSSVVQQNSSLVSRNDSGQLIVTLVTSQSGVVCEVLTEIDEFVGSVLLSGGGEIFSCGLVDVLVLDTDVSGRVFCVIYSLSNISSRRALNTSITLELGEESVGSIGIVIY